MRTLFRSNRKFFNKQISTVVYSSGSADDYFGYATSLNSDGTTLAVGAYNDRVGTNNGQGSCTIFTRTNKTWNQQAYITYSSGAAGHKFGHSVALSNDGNTLAVGAPHSASGTGYCVVYTRSGTTWTQQAYLVYSGALNGDSFGCSVALSGDGNTLVVGAATDTVSTVSYQGSCTVFVRSGTTWTQQGYLTYVAVDNNGSLGSAVAISDDGNTIVASASGDGGDGATIGLSSLDISSSTVTNNTSGIRGGESDYALTTSAAHGLSTGDTIILDTNKTQINGQYILGNSGATRVVVTNSTTITVIENTRSPAITAPITGTITKMSSSASIASQGTCLVFVRSGTTWTRQAYLANASATAYSYLGLKSLTISNDGNTVIAGAASEDPGAANGRYQSGSCSVFTRNGVVWTQQTNLTYSTLNQGDYFGSSVSLSGDGNTLAVGAYGVDKTVTNAGALSIFKRSSTKWTIQSDLVSPTQQSDAVFGGTTSISKNGDVLVVGAYAADVGANLDQGACFVYYRR